MGLKLDLGLGVNSGNGVPSDYALEFNGTDEYLQIGLPTELVTNGNFETGVNTFNWTLNGVTATWNDTELGKTGNYCLKMVSAGVGYKDIIKYSILTTGKKYKIKLRYKSTTAITFINGANGTNRHEATSEWCSISFIITSVDGHFGIQQQSAVVGSTTFIDDISIVEDQGFDLNKDQEMILHSKNWDFEGSTTDWAGTGNHSVSLSALDKSSGTQSLLISASGAGDENNCVVLSASYLESCLRDKKYTLEGFGRSDTASRTLTMKMGSKQVTSSTLSTTSGSFTKAVLNFLATASEENADLKLWLSGAGNVYVDKLSLTQKYDVVYIPMNKVNDTSGYYTIFGKYIGTAGGFYGDYLWYDTTTGKLQYFASDGSGILSGRAILTTSGLTPATWNKITVVSKFDEIKIYRNGVELASSTLTNQFGKVIVNQALGIGGFTIGSVYPFKGQISHLQIIRFENISQSTFNSAITGLQYPTGGGAEEVLRVTFQSGVSITECLKDYSPKGHTVSGVLVDITNRKRVTR